MLTLHEAVSYTKTDLLHYRSMIPETAMTALKLIDLNCKELVNRKTQKKPKGYSLGTRPHKRLGEVYYVRYWHRGKMLSSKWSTRTNDYEVASEFAERYRELIIGEYESKNTGEMFQLLKIFYDKNSQVYKSESKRNGEVCEATRKRYESIAKKDFSVFLKGRGIKFFEEITVSLLDDFQDVLLAKGKKSKSVNNDLTAVGKIFDYLLRKGKIKANPYLSLSRVPEKPNEKKARGCYEIEKLKGVFNNPWKGLPYQHYLLNMLIYSTDMRNSEIKRIRKKDIVTIKGVRFIDLKESKTENGIRLVPLHNKVYERIIYYAREMNEDERIFGNVTWYAFSNSALSLGKRLRLNDDYLEKHYITFYSGRHFWKTMMSAGGLGEDAEEFFMGHKVSSNVAKLYNHRDKQGKGLLVKKAKEAIKILDKYLFTI